MTFLSWIITMVLIFAAAVFFPITLTRITGNPIFEFVGRAIASFVCLVICATYGTIASACLNLAGYGGLGQWTTARSFKWSMYMATGVWFEIDDSNNWLGKTRPAVFIGNHQTELDVLMLGHMFPKYCSVTAKKSLKNWPFLGWFMAMSKTVFIERKSRTQAMEAFAGAAKQMKSHGQSVFIFPEGTRSYYDYPDLMAFKKGAFHFAVQAQVPIVPVVVANYSNVLNMRRRFFRPGTIPVKVLAPIATVGKTTADVDSLVEETRSKMLAELKIISVDAQRQGIALPAEHTGGKDLKAKSSGIDSRISGPQAVAS